MFHTLVTKCVKNFLSTPDFIGWSPGRESGQETESISYERTEPILSEAVGLDDEDLIRLNVGAFSEDAGMAGISGNSYMSVVGAAGETAQVGNIPEFVMADGTAELHLS